MSTRHQRAEALRAKDPTRTISFPPTAERRSYEYQPSTVQIEQLAGWRLHFEIPPALAALPGPTDERVESLIGEDPPPGAVVFAKVDERVFVVAGSEYLDALQGDGLPVVGNDGRPCFYPHFMHALKEGEDLDELVLHLNVRDVAARRLPREKMRELTEWVLRNHTEWSDRRIAVNLAVSQNTVAVRRQKLIDAGKIPDLDKLEGADRRWRRWRQREKNVRRARRCSHCGVWFRAASVLYPGGAASVQICLFCVEEALTQWPGIMRDVDEASRSVFKQAARDVGNVIRHSRVLKTAKRHRSRLRK